MKNTTWVGFAPFVAAAVLASPACKKKDDKSAEKMVEKGSGEAKPAPAKPVGLADPTNDAEIVGWAKQLLTDCGAEMDKSNDNAKLPNQKKNIYYCDKYRDDFGSKSFDKKDATLVNFLEDPDVKVRAVGLRGLDNPYDWKKDKALATKIVEGLKKEKAPSPIDLLWAIRVANIRDEAGVNDQIAAIAADPKASTDVKLGLWAWWGKGNDAAYQAIKANATSTDPDVINAVVQGYAMHFHDHADEACAYWVANLEAKNEQAADSSLGHLTGGRVAQMTTDTESEDWLSGGGGGPGDSDEDKRCSDEQLGKGLDLVEKQFAAGSDDSKYADTLAFLAKDKAASKAVKDRVIKDLKAMVEKKESSPRTAALRALYMTDDAALKKYVTGFKKDPDLKSTVEFLTAK